MIVFDKVAAIIQKQLGVSEDKILSDANIVDDLGADSLDVVELIMALEDEFKLVIPDKEAEKLSNVGDVVKYLESLL